MTSKERNALARIRAAWMSHNQLQKTLEQVGIECAEDSTDELRDALVANVDDGTIDIDYLPETGTQTESRILELYS